MLKKILKIEKIERKKNRTENMLKWLNNFVHIKSKFGLVYRCLAGIS